jgi:hypothetical protein
MSNRFRARPGTDLLHVVDRIVHLAGHDARTRLHPLDGPALGDGHLFGRLELLEDRQPLVERLLRCPSVQRLIPEAVADQHALVDALCMLDAGDDVECPAELAQGEAERRDELCRRAVDELGAKVDLARRQALAGL